MIFSTANSITAISHTESHVIGRCGKQDTPSILKSPAIKDPKLSCGHLYGGQGYGHLGVPFLQVYIYRHPTELTP